MSYNWLALVSTNLKDDERVSSIDIDGIDFKNFDGMAYQDFEKLKKEKLELTAQNKEIE